MSCAGLLSPPSRTSGSAGLEERPFSAEKCLRGRETFISIWDSIKSNLVPDTSGRLSGLPPRHTESLGNPIAWEGAGRRLAGPRYHPSSLGSTSKLPGLKCQHRWTGRLGPHTSTGACFPESRPRLGEDVARRPCPLRDTLQFIYHGPAWHCASLPPTPGGQPGSLREGKSHPANTQPSLTQVRGTVTRCHLSIHGLNHRAPTTGQKIPQQAAGRAGSWAHPLTCVRVVEPLTPPGVTREASALGVWSSGR